MKSIDHQIKIKFKKEKITYTCILQNKQDMKEHKVQLHENTFHQKIEYTSQEPQ